MIPTRHHNKQARADLLINRCRRKAHAIDDKASEAFERRQYALCRKYEDLADHMLSHLDRLRKLRGSVGAGFGDYKSLTNPASCYFD